MFTITRAVFDFWSFPSRLRRRLDVLASASVSDDALVVCFGNQLAE